MSRELKIRDSVLAALCAAAGLEPRDVVRIEIRPDCIIYEVIVEPVSVTADGYATVLVTHPYS